MAKKQPLEKDENKWEVEGVVEEALPNATFRVRIEAGLILAHISGKIRKNNIQIYVGDKVTVEMDAYDVSKGRITYRNR